MTQGFGIDVGGTGIKGAVVDLDKGELASERLRIDTPQPGTPEAVLEVIERLLHEQGWQGPVGCTFPGIVQHGRIGSAANLVPEWAGIDLQTELSARFGHPVKVLNDADAAGLAEMQFGAGRGLEGVVLMLTLGTGIGSALFIDGTLVPNTELGHLELDGHVAEHQAATSAREREGLEYDEWARTRLQPYFTHVERLFSPDVFIIGGGVSKRAEQFVPLLQTNAEIVVARLRNQAGIVGAAVAGGPA